MVRVPSIPRLEQPGATERFYQLLLELERHANAITLIDEALRLIAKITSATTVYVEMFGGRDEPTMSRGYDVEARTQDAISASVSRDVVSQVVAEHRTLAFDSKSNHGVVTSLCVPIRADGVIGIVWLESKETRFSELDRERARLLAGRLAAMRVANQRQTLDEVTERCIQEALHRCNGNISEVARELQVSRAFIYAVMKRLRDRT